MKNKFNNLRFWFIFGIKLRMLNQNYIKDEKLILNKMAVMTKKCYITQILQSLYNFISTLVLYKAFWNSKLIYQPLK